MQELVQRHQVLMTMHGATTANEDEVLLRYFGKRSIPRLADLGLLTPRLVLSHAGYLTDEDVRLIAEGGSTVNHNPMQNAIVGKGIGARRAVPRLLRAGANVALGTDSVPTYAPTLIESIRTAMLMHNDAEMDWAALPLPQAFAMATTTSARGLGIDRLGSLEVGQLADLLILDSQDIRYALKTQPFAALIDMLLASDVASVVVGGKLLLEEKHFLDLDEQATFAEAQALIKDL